jgi:hypothetical protein
MSAIPLKDFTPGDYTLVIALSDEIAKATAAVQESFRVK